MANAARYYFWAVFAVSGLDALLRLGLTKRLSELQGEKLAVPGARTRRKWIGWGALALSPLVLLYGFWGHIPSWMWLSVLYGVIAGLEQITSSEPMDPTRMRWQVRSFGVMSAVMAILVYVVFLKR